MQNPWYRIAVEDRIEATPQGWRAALPEFAWLGGKSRALRLHRPDRDPQIVEFDGHYAIGNGPCPSGPDLWIGPETRPGPWPGQIWLILDAIAPPFQPWKGAWRHAVPLMQALWPLPLEVKGTPLALLWNGAPLAHPWAGEWDKTQPGFGHDRQGWLGLRPPEDRDPNLMGGIFELAVLSLADWPLPVVQWPAGGPFRHLPDGLALPVYAGLGLTNKCNLRCEICGSQSDLDRTGQARIFTPIEQIRILAATSFPFLREVELNSLGEPTLHREFPEILDLIANHGCLLKIQTNATLLRPEIVERLAASQGSVWMSIDAVGPLFEQARKLGRWPDVERGVAQLMSKRDPRKLLIGLYPTLTRRTLPGALDLLDWADRMGIDCVHFHLYEPIQDSPEQAPSASEIQDLTARIGAWLHGRPNPPDIQLGLTRLRNTGRDKQPDWVQKITRIGYHPSHPVAKQEGSAHPNHLCQAPWQQLDFGLDGAWHACCRAQTTDLGHAWSIPDFAQSWFGARYERLRASLQRVPPKTENPPMELPECAICIRKFFGPTHSVPPGAILLEPPYNRDQGKCVIADLPSAAPLGDDTDQPARSDLELYENGIRLGPAHQPHAVIRSLGHGRFSHWGRQLYFSASDDSDPTLNGRTYWLHRPQAKTRSPGMVWRQRAQSLIARWFGPKPQHRSQILRPPYQAYGGQCWKFESLQDFGPGDTENGPNQSALALFEDGQPLGPMHAAHDDIAERGEGRFSHWQGRLWFSSSDGSDPNGNGRSYEVRLDQGRYIAQHAERAAAIVQGWLGHLPNGHRDLTGKTVLELGPGSDLGTLMLLAALGAGSVLGLERRPPRWDRHFHPALARALIQAARQLDLPVDAEMLERAARHNLSALPIALPPSWHRIQTPLDLVLSHSVLEHLDDMPADLAHLAKRCRPGGIGIHDVDFRDHRNFSRPLEFLLADEPSWRTENGDYPFRHGNRLRLDQVQDLLRQAGFLGMDCRITAAIPAGYLQEFLPRLTQSASLFADFAPDRLTVASATLVVRRSD